MGNVIVLFGALTGRDGIGGASVLASAELGEDEDKRPSVQIGDPFEEKKLLESSLELLDRGLLASLQDLGAAGLTSSSSEMASKGEVGIEIDVDKVPLREADMEPFEVMISESQERMLCVVEPDKLDEVLAVCEKWEVRATAIGTVTDTRRLRVLAGGEVVGDMPVEALVDDCPLYDLEPAEPREPIYPAPPAQARRQRVAGRHAARAPGIAERRLEAVGVRAVRLDRRIAHHAPAGGGRRRGAHARARRRHRRDRRLDRRQRPPRRVRPVHGRRRGGARVRAQPRLRRGRAARPHELPELRQPGEAAHRLAAHARGRGPARRVPRRCGAPVVGGNVSLYNEGGGGPIFPTPVVGMVGKLPDPATVPWSAFREPGHAIALVGPFAPSLAGSELEKLAGPALDASCREIDLAAHAAALDAVRDGGPVGLGRDGARHLGGRPRRARSPSARSAAASARRSSSTDDFPLFGEGPGGVLLAGPRDALEQLAESLQPHGFRVIGETGGDRLDITAGVATLSVPVAAAQEAHDGSLPSRFE